jgi:hypothetical protein
MSFPLVFQAGDRDEIDETYNWYETRDRGLGEEFNSWPRSTWFWDGSCKARNAPP